MGISRDHWHKRRKTGGKRKEIRCKRKFEIGRQPANTRIGERRVHKVRGYGGFIKFRALKIDHGNFSWPGEAISRKCRIVGVVYNASNNEYVRTNTLVKGSIVQIDSTPFKNWYQKHYGVTIGKVTPWLKPKKVHKVKWGEKPKKVRSPKIKAKKEEKKAVKKGTKGGKGIEKKGTKGAEKKPGSAKTDKATVAKVVAKKTGEKKPAVEKKAVEKKAVEKKAVEKKAKTEKKVEEKVVKKTGDKKDKKEKRKYNEGKHKASGAMKKKWRLRGATRVLEQALQDQFDKGRLYARISSRPGQIGCADGYVLEGEELAFYTKKIGQKKRK